MQFVRRFLNHDGGATIIEFAIVAPVFFLLLFGILEYGLYMFHKIAIESIVMKAGREATLGRSNSDGCSTSKDRVEYITCYVHLKTAGLINGNETTIQVNPISEGGTAVPDICLKNGGHAVDPPQSLPNCDGNFEEINLMKGYQGPAGSDSGIGGQIMEIRVNYPWRVLIPFMAEFFGGIDRDPNAPQGQRTGVVMISSATVVKNEPFGGSK